MKKIQKIRKVITLLCMLNIWMFVFSGNAYAQESATENATETILDQFSFDDLDDTLQDLFPEKRLEFREILKEILSGDLTMSAELLNQLLGDLFGYVWKSSRMNLIHILIIALIAAVFSNFTRIFQSKQIADISFYVSYLLIIALSLSTFSIVTEWVNSGVQNLTKYMGAFCPVFFLAVAIAKGSVTAVAFYNLVLFFIYLVELLILKFLLPMIHVYMMMKVLNYLAEEEYLSRFADLIETVTAWCLKTLLAVVVGLNVIQGLISPAIDTIKQNTITRSAEAIPGIGDILSGMAEVALATAVLVKNGIGMAGAVLCIGLCLIPLVQVAGVAFLYKLIAAMLQPISDKRVVGCIEAVGDGCQLLLKVIFTSGILFLLTIVLASTFTSQI